MAYATNLQFVQKTGLGLRIVDENVGTGDASETDFDLDQTNIISGSYVLSYAASGSNNFTALTETTHYTLDKESGRVLLTGDGVTALSTNILYATYWYTDNFSDAQITDLITAADDEIDKVTSRRWDSATSVIEYRNGRGSLGYPTTDRPFANDWDAPDFIVLDRKPATTIDAVYFLSRPLQVGKCFNYDTGGAAYTDITDNINSVTETPINIFDAAPATGDIIYIGSGVPFLGLRTVLSTVGTDNGTTAIDWEYYNGSAWADITETDDTTGASIFTASGKFTWTYPYGWNTTTVNSYSAYWIRGTLTDDYSADPVAATFKIEDPINTVVEPYQWILRGEGQLNFIDVNVPDGTNNIRIDYNYGNATTPTYISDLSVHIASVRAFVNLSGGSYDDATSYTLGSKSVTIGEVYVNIREVITQIKKRIEELYALTGKRADVVAI